MAPLYPLIFDAEFLQTTPEKDKKGSSICDPIEGGTDCGSAGISQYAEHGQSPKASKRSSLSWRSKVGTQFNALSV